MSIWADIQDRSEGIKVRKEDKLIDVENSWGIDVSIDILKKQQIKLRDEISQLQRELASFKWDKNINKCKYFKS